MKQPSASQFWSNALSILLIKWWRAISADFLGWYAYCLGRIGNDFRVPSLKYLSIRFSSVLTVNDVRLIGLSDLASWYDTFPNFGINTTLTPLQTSGMYRRLILATKISKRWLRMWYMLWWSKAGNIPSSPADLKGENVVMAHLIFSLDTIWSDSDLSPLRGTSNGLIVIGIVGDCEFLQPGKCVSSKCLNDSSGESVNSQEGSFRVPIEQIGSFDNDLIRLAVLLCDTVVLHNCCFLSLLFLRRAALYSDWARL